MIFKVEAPGVEPGSEDALKGASTRVACSFDFAARADERQPARVASPPFVSPGDRWSLSPGQSDYFRWLRAPDGSSGHRRYLKLGGESNSVIIRSCRVAHFYVAMGATTRDSLLFIPVETVSPPCHGVWCPGGCPYPTSWGCMARASRRRVGSVRGWLHCGSAPSRPASPAVRQAPHVAQI